MNVLLINNRRALRRERLFRDRTNPLEIYDNLELKRLFRFERENILQLTHGLSHRLQRETGRSNALPPIIQVCIALRFYGTGSMQLSLGSWLNVDQATVSRTVWRVTRSIVAVYSNLVNLNTNATKDGFYERYRIPNIVGAIDCTHIPIKKPPNRFHPDEYLNRKNFHSINVQAICNSEYKFTDVVVAWPGSVHDSRIFKNSSIYDKLINREINGVLLGDNGYSNLPILLTPFLNPQNDAEENYNRIHKTTRCVIERSFGQFKKRFFSMAIPLRINIERASTTIMACTILHNLAKSFNDPDFNIDLDAPVDIPLPAGDIIFGNDLRLRRLGEIKRQEMVDALNNLH